MPNAQSPQSDPAESAARPSQLFGDGTALEDVSFLTVAEVAGVMRVSKMTVYRMVHSGELTAVRVGRSFRVPAKAVREYLSGAYVGTE
jgi:excisionase family DNA binding protein